MGSITYDGTIIHFEDRLLTHLQIVIVHKFARNESFLMSWKDSDAMGDGRSSVWLAPTIPIYFKFLGSRVPAINDHWLLTLRQSAESSTGLIVTSEDGSLAEASESHGHRPGAMVP